MERVEKIIIDPNEKDGSRCILPECIAVTKNTQGHKT